MKPFFAIFILVVLTAIFLASPHVHAENPSIVPPHERISDLEARLSLARLLSWDPATLSEAADQYRIILKDYPQNTGVKIEAAEIFLRLNALSEASAVLAGIAVEPADARALAVMADLECRMGHALRCRDLYQAAVDKNDAFRLRFADAMNMWGDFYKAKTIYRNYLRKDPADKDVALRLARTLANSQRYEESESVYQAIIDRGHPDARTLAGYADMKLQEKDFVSSEKYAREALSLDPANTGAMRCLAESYVYRGRYNDARKVYQDKPGSADNADNLVFIGKMFLKEKNKGEAETYLVSALRTDPGNIPAQFYAHWPDTVRSEDFVRSVAGNDQASPALLAQWADLYVSEGWYSQAMDCLDAAITRDPDHFPALISRAQVLGSMRRFNEAVDAYSRLLEKFPDNPKIMIGMARVLGWSRQYAKSIEMYQKVIALDPGDPVPRREMARVYMWAKDEPGSMKTYDEARSAGTGTPVTGEAAVFETSAETRNRIQRSLSLEAKAKKLAFEKKFARSLPVYDDLIALNPGNEEALFDKAQAACALGLCGLEAATYDRLLMLDPLHFLAAEARDWQRLRARPAARFDYLYWNEEGRGDLARITRQSYDASVDVPIDCKYRIFLTGHRWLEQPDYNHRTYGAIGFSAGFNGTLNQFIKADALWTHKEYDSSSLGTRDTGHATAWFNANDAIRIGAGYARTDEIYNYFGIDQGVQADRLWLGFQSDITRRLEIGGRAEYINYNDSNNGAFLGLTTGYALTDHPRIFKISAAGEWRDTRHDNEYIYYNGVLTNIIHPYWAPRNYVAGSLIFEWYHDLSKSFICGSAQHFYDIKIAFGTDTENNPYAKIEGEWNVEFAKRWYAGIKGLYHTSPEWVATGAFAQLRYRF